MEELLPKAVPGFSSANVVDCFVARYPGAVTWFSPGSFSKRPPLQTTVKNLVCAGDWVRMGDREHGAKGLCQVTPPPPGAHPRTRPVTHPTLTPAPFACAGARLRRGPGLCHGSGWFAALHSPP